MNCQFWMSIFCAPMQWSLIIDILASAIKYKCNIVAGQEFNVYSVFLMFCLLIFLLCCAINNNLHKWCHRVSCFFWANKSWKKQSMYFNICPGLICPESNDKYITMCLNVSEVFILSFWSIFLHTNKENGTGGLSYKSIWTLLEPFPLAILVVNYVKLPKTREEDHLS